MSPSVPASPAVIGEVPPGHMPINHKYFPALDGLRAAAFLLVFAQHYLNMLLGWSGVDVFFVLSGFLITGILYDTRDQPHRVRNFYVRRTLRIFPLYYGLMFLLLVSYPLFRWSWDARWLLWPAYLGNFLHGIHPFEGNLAWQQLVYFQLMSRTVSGFQLYLGHFWSLCVEEQFYLFWPCVVFLVRDRKKLIVICCAFLILCPVMRDVASRIVPQFMMDQQITYEWTPFRVDALLLGGLIALIRRGPSPLQLLKPARILFCVLLSMLLVYLPYELRRTSDGLEHPNWLFTWGLLFVDLFSACLIVMALEPGSITYRVFNLRPLRWLGQISYGAYVFHDIFHKEIEAVVEQFTESPKYATAAVAFVITLLLSWASYRWYESIFIRLKDRWTVQPAATAEQR